MLRISSWLRVVMACVAAVALFGSALGATVFQTTELLTAPNATTPVRPAMSFDVTAAGDHTLTLTDLGAPAALATLRAIVTRDLQVVATVAIAPVTGGTRPVPASIAFAGVPGRYRVHVLGVIAQNQSAGAYAVRVAPTSGGAALLDTAEVLAINSQTAAATTALQADFQIADAGTYRLEVTDHAFPVALARAPEVVLLPQSGGGTLPVVLAGDGSFTATSGTYTIIVVATADATAGTGLFSASVRGGPSNARVYGAVRGVGRMPAPVSVTLPAGQVDFTVTDVAFPSALASVTAALIQNDAVIGKLNSPGTTSIPAANGTAQLYAVANAAQSEGVGAFAVKLAQGGTVAFESVRIADNSPEAASPAIYSVTSSNALAAGSYRVALRDLDFASPLGALRAAITQGADVLDRIDAAGDKTLDLRAAPLRILIAARPAAGGANGVGVNSLFAVQVTAQPSGTSILETTQGVGGLFHSVPVTIATAGRYDMTLADLEFPNSLGSAALAVTQGTSQVGQVFGAGVLRQELTPGTYVLNFLGAPISGATHGAYGLRVADAPPMPTVRLTAAAASVVSGSSTTIEWSTTDATSCAASQGWSGARATSGSQSVGPLTTATTYEINCTGPGGSASATTTVAVAAPGSASKGGGGGGSLDGALLLMLTAAAFARVRRPQRRR